MPPPQEREDALFRAAAVLPAGAARQAYLDQACADDSALRARVEALLAAHDRLEELPAAPLARATINLELDGPPDEALGVRIGHYKLLQKIGEGGCGVVYMAEQEEPVRRRVALKVIKLGMDTKQVVARFEVERQALAMMDHPGIARVFDGGVTETGRPYFVMELVKGIKLTDYCDENQLSTEARLGLFMTVCHAIQHAHQKGIIHRDLKPSNILVSLLDGEPVPKVIDFGIAKATEQKLTDKTLVTELHQFLGTPAYMSPEQAEMSGLDVDTRSDIYSLGVLLYELLTGRTPFDQKELLQAGLDEMRRIIREVEPARPSTRLHALTEAERTTTAARRRTEAPQLIHRLRGDLDWIVMKCLEKDRTRRYETANALAADLQRHLENEPVEARPPSAGYKLRKFARRNRVALGVAGALAGVLVVATGVSVWQAVRATRAEVLAQERLRQSEAITKFLTGVFRSPDPSRDGRTITVAETLDTAVKNLDRDLGDQRALRAQLQGTLGETYNALGLLREAIPLLEQARDYCLTNAGPEHPDTLAVMHRLALAYRADERVGQADELWRQILSVRRKVLGPEHPDTLTAMQGLAKAYAAVGRHDEALALLEQLVESRRKVFGPEHRYTLEAMSDRASAYFTAGRGDEAFALLGDESARNPANTILTLKLATLQLWLGKEADYTATCRRMLQWAADHEGPEPADRAGKITNLRPSADPQMRQAALAFARRAVELGRTNSSLPWFQMGLGMAEYRSGHYPAADEALAAAARATQKWDPAGRARIQGTAEFYRAMSLFRQGKAAEARQLFTETEATMKPLPADDKNPLANGADQDDMIVWLAYKEARALINPPRTSSP